MFASRGIQVSIDLGYSYCIIYLSVVIKIRQLRTTMYCIRNQEYVSSFIKVVVA